ncbi:RHS repeat-associated core domain-containing protein [Pseudomonas putida]|uniref:RHS repeat-associated core domain-containing protein n=1 Tax=Pseudomonas putida TaxID=303 RepID=UPI003D95B08C
MSNSRANQPAKQPAVAQQRLSRAFLLAPDFQQSILAVQDGTRLEPFAYSPYGFQSGLRQATTHLGFNGQLKERPTGWYHLGNGHRVYNPILMRFHSPDRLSSFGKGGMNAYAYCQGDPLNYTDPTGEFMASALPIIQRGLTVALHTVTPAALIFGPKASGVALQATRVSLAGSITTAAGAVMQLAGYPVGAIVGAAGTTALVAGAATRGAVALKNAYQANRLWTTVKENVKTIVGWPASAKPLKSPTTLTSVISENPPDTLKNIRDSQ